MLFQSPEDHNAQSVYQGKDSVTVKAKIKYPYYPLVSVDEYQNWYKFINLQQMSEGQQSAEGSSRHFESHQSIQRTDTDRTPDQGMQTPVANREEQPQNQFIIKINELASQMKQLVQSAQIHAKEREKTNSLRLSGTQNWSQIGSSVREHDFGSPRSVKDVLTRNHPLIEKLQGLKKTWKQLHRFSLQQTEKTYDLFEEMSKKLNQFLQNWNSSSRQEEQSKSLFGIRKQVIQMREQFLSSTSNLNSQIDWLQNAKQSLERELLKTQQSSSGQVTSIKYLSDHQIGSKNGHNLSEEVGKWKDLYQTQQTRNLEIAQSNEDINEELFICQQKIAGIELQVENRVKQILVHFVSVKKHKQLSTTCSNLVKENEDLKRKCQNLDRQSRNREEKIRTRELEYIAREKALDEREEDILKEWNAVEKTREQNQLREAEIQRKASDVERKLEEVTDRQLQAHSLMNYPRKNKVFGENSAHRMAAKDNVRDSYIFGKKSSYFNIEESNAFLPRPQPENDTELFRSKSNEVAKQSQNFILKYFSSRQPGNLSPINNNSATLRTFFMPEVCFESPESLKRIPFSQGNPISKRIGTMKSESSRFYQSHPHKVNQSNLAGIQSKLEKLRQEIRKQIIAID